MAEKKLKVNVTNNLDKPQEQPIVNDTANVLEEIGATAEGINEEHLEESRLPADQEQTTQETTQEYTPGQTPGKDAPDAAQQAIENGKLNLALILPAKNIMKGLDAAIAGLLALGATKMSKKRVKSDIFKMDADQLKNASTALEQCLKTINLNFNNPWLVFALLTGGVYVGKAQEMAAEIYAQRMEDEGNEVKTISKKPGAKRGPKGPRKPKAEPVVSA